MKVIQPSPCLYQWSNKWNWRKEKEKNGWRRFAERKSQKSNRGISLQHKHLPAPQPNKVQICGCKTHRWGHFYFHIFLLSVYMILFPFFFWST